MSELTSHSLFKNGYFVAGEWHDTQAHFPVINPATGATLTEVAKAGSKETEQAIAAAAEALPEWRKRTAKSRSELLYRWYQLILENTEWLAMLMTAEQGKPLKEAKGEVLYAASYIQWFAEQAKRANGEIIPSPAEGNRVFAMREPIGVVAAITPWNFPMAMLTRKLGPALAAGCTSVIKPANNTPLCAFALVELARQAGIPAGVINAVAGDTSKISDSLMASDKVRKISFTGSTAVGKILMKKAADTMKKVAMELGGNAPFIVFADADLAAAVQGALAIKFGNAGQVCVSANRFYIHDSIYDQFVKQFSHQIAQLKVGDGRQEGVDIGPLIEDSAVEKVVEHIEDAKKQGAKILVGGEQHMLGGRFFQPTLIAEASDEMRIAKEETFGPVAACFRFQSEEEVIARANATEYGLAAYFYSKDVTRIFRVADALESGMIGINYSSVSNEMAPFGGVKQSGLGREGSVLGLEEFMEIKTLHLGGL
jgi:succinate-semialdehyde dehydrogenase / glutarate-semialdehyde dehydrogenase